MKGSKKGIHKEHLLKGSVEVIGWEECERKALFGQKLKIKHGIDPTAPDLHLGYAVVYTVLRRFQDLGHTVQFLIGDFTATVGDPTDKDMTRPRLSRDQIQKNVKSCLKQVGKILDLKTLEVRYNSEWWSKTKLKEFMEIAAHVSAARLWERDMFERRLQQGNTVAVHEFLYPILQGYDSVMLKSDATVIGTDQKFNELMGRELQEQYGQEKQALIMMPILPGTDGIRKMSQSLGNYIGIVEPAEEQFGKIMSIPDALMPIYFELLTEKSGRDSEKQLKDPKVNPRDSKMELGRLIVGRLHGEKAAMAAQERFVNQFQKGNVEGAQKMSVGKSAITIVEALQIAGLASSKSEARRLVEQKGVSVDGELIALPDAVVAIKPGGTVLKKGRHYRLLLP